jgi:aminoglycoside phosphotransferase (APT) family kinase protein
MTLIDSPTKIREGEELDITAVESYLKDSIPGLDGNLTVQQYPSGYSNLTYLIQVGNRKLVLRRPPYGTKAKSAHDMGREYRILSALKKAFPYCPQPLSYTDDEAIIGSPFYVMDRIEGIILRKNFPQNLNFSPAEMKQLCQNLVDVLLELHQVDFNKIGLNDLGKPEGYIRRQVEGWSRRYRAAKTPDAPDYEQIMGWLDKNQPADSEHPTLIHNDYKLDNIVLDPANPLKIIGVLDWELATIGDPLMDLGATLAYWVNRNDSEEMQLIRFQPSNAEGALSRQEILNYYQERAGIQIADFSFYQCCNLFRVATIVQQIYYRYYHGQTKDKRFAFLISAVQIIEKAIMKILEKQG